MEGDQDKEESNGPSPRLARLTLAALGVVFGDIGTSPLYAVRECFEALGSDSPTPDQILGVLSLIFWSLIIVVTVKYMVFVMRADNRGEGGILALMTLVAPAGLRASKRHFVFIGLGLFGAALLYGDGMITPAISVLSAVEGLEVATPLFKPFVLPIACTILVGFFSIQRRGTATVGAIFGPITVVWFLCLGALGLRWIVTAPELINALNPAVGVGFLLSSGLPGFIMVGAVFLVVTGAEALYADMGHFGIAPIRLAWIALVLPALLLNYFGQGALLLHHPEAIHNPFFRMAPSWALYPLVGLAMVATVIASQAVVSGAFSLTGQAMQLGYCPHMEIRHSSAEEMGQVYVPFINWFLMVATLALVLGFGSSSELAGAYGVAVTTTMVITTLLAGACARRRWNWGWPAVVLTTIALLTIDLAFFGANIIKITQGGWVPILVALLVFLVMVTWADGVDLVSRFELEAAVSEEDFVTDLSRHSLTRVPGIGVFMSGHPVGIPRTLLHNIKHNKVMRESVILMTIVTDDVPKVTGADRIEMKEYGQGIVRLIGHFGFMQVPNAPLLMKLRAVYHGIPYREAETTYFLGNETIVVGEGNRGMMSWRKSLFSFLLRNSYRAQLHFGIRTDRVVEIGARVDI